MALCDFRCLACGHVFEAVRLVRDWPQTPPCETCGAATEQTHLPPAVRWRPDPVVVYQAPDGSYRFPPATTSLSTAMYDRQGFTRIELRGSQEVRAFEHRVEEHERSHMARCVERETAQREAVVSERHAEIRRGMQQGFRQPEMDSRGEPTGRMMTVRLGAAGRDVMREAIARTNRIPAKSVKDPGFHVRAYSHDSNSNRDD